MAQVLNNAAYSVQLNNSNEEIIVPVGEIVNYSYNDDSSISLMGYNSLNYHEHISKSLVSLANSITNIESINSDIAINNITVAKESALSEIANSISSVTSEVVELAQNSVLLSLDKIESDISLINEQALSTKTAVDDINSKIGKIDGTEGVFYDINMLNSVIYGSSSDGVLNDIIDIKDNISALPTFGSIDPLLPSLDDDVLPYIQKNRNLFVSVNENISSLKNAINNETDGILIRLNDTTNVTNSLNDQINGDDGIQSIITNISEITDNLGLSTLGTDLSTNTANISTLQTSVSDIETTVDSNLATISLLVADIGDADLDTGIKGNIKTIFSNIGSADENTGILGKLKELEKIDNVALNEIINGTAADPSTGLVSKFENLETSTITPAVQAILTYDSVYYNGSKLSELFGNLDADAINTIQTTFNDVFYDVDGNLMSIDTLLSNALSSWVTDNFDIAITQFLPNNDYVLSDILTPIAVLTSDDTVEGSVDYKINQLATEFNSVVSTVEILTDDTNSNSIKSKIDLSIASYDVDTIGEIRTNISNINDLNDEQNTQLTLLNESVNLNTNNIDELQAESAKYLALLPWLKTMLTGIADGTLDSVAIASDIDDKIERIRNLTSNTYVDETIIYNSETSNFIVLINLDKDEQFDDTHFVVNIIHDDVLYFKKYELTSNELMTNKVNRTFDSIVLSDGAETPTEYTMTESDVNNFDFEVDFASKSFAMGLPLYTGRRASSEF